jgi:hypothetical protein
MNVVIYYPYIRVPESAWFSRLLLYWDDVATIVPEDWIYAPERLGPYTQELVQRNLVIQAFPNYADIHALGGRFLHFLTPLPEAFGFALLSPRLIQRAAGVLGIDLIVGQCVPMILLISDLFPTQYRESVAFLSQQAPTYRAMASCVDSLPAELRGLDGARRLRRLPKTEQSRLIMDWASHHRGEAAILDIDPADAVTGQQKTLLDGAGLTPLMRLHA